MKYPTRLQGPWKETLETLSGRNVNRHLFTLWRLVSPRVNPWPRTCFFRLEGPPCTVGERSKKAGRVYKQRTRSLNGKLQESYPGSVYQEDRVTNSDPCTKNSSTSGTILSKENFQLVDRFSKVGLIFVVYSISSRPMRICRASK
jgi:hypothetical protein